MKRLFVIKKNDNYKDVVEVAAYNTKFQKLSSIMCGQRDASFWLDTMRDMCESTEMKQDNDSNESA